MLKLAVKHVFLFSSLCFLISCSHPPKNSLLNSNWTPPTKKSYSKKLRSLTKKHQEYSGLSQVFEADTTFLNSDLQKMQLLLKANYKNWTIENAEQASEELSKNLTKESKFFINFFTPNPKLNKVDKSFADWSVILIQNGKETPGIVALHENEADHVKFFYPHVHPWGRTYMVKFPVSTKDLQQNNFQVKIVGPLGMGIVKYKSDTTRSLL